MDHDDLGQFQFMGPVNRQINTTHRDAADNLWADATSHVQHAVREPIGQIIKSNIRRTIRKDPA